MAKFCLKCGTEAIEHAAYCSSCGQRLDPPAPSTAFDGKNGTEPLAQNLAAVFCYAMGIVSGILFLNIDPYRKDPLIRFHAWQSIYLWATAVGLMILPRVFFFFSFLWLIAIPAYLGALVLWLILIVKSYNGEKFKIPVLGDLAEKQARR